MAYTVTTYLSAADMEAAVGGTVTLCVDESAVDIALSGAIGPTEVVYNGTNYTVIDQFTGTRLFTAKGAGYTVATDA